MYQNALVGRATVTNLVLVPGNNSVAGEFHYGPTDPTNSDLVTQYLQRPSYKEGSTDLIPIFIKGDSQSSPYGSLVEALEGVTINSAFPGLGTKLVNFIQVNIDFVTAFCNDTVAIQFKINNTLSTQIFVINLDALAAQPRGDNYASLTSATLQPTPFPAAANSITGFSQNIPNVVLLKGLIGSLPILTNQFDPTKGLDLVRDEVQSKLRALILTLGLGRLPRSEHLSSRPRATLSRSSSTTRTLSPTVRSGPLVLCGFC